MAVMSSCVRRQRSSAAARPERGQAAYATSPFLVIVMPVALPPVRMTRGCTTQRPHARRDHCTRTARETGASSPYGMGLRCVVLLSPA
jgi:hypothetical protein